MRNEHVHRTAVRLALSLRRYVRLKQVNAPDTIVQNEIRLLTRHLDQFERAIKPMEQVNFEDED